MGHWVRNATFKSTLDVIRRFWVLTAIFRAKPGELNMIFQVRSLCGDYQIIMLLYSQHPWVVEFFLTGTIIGPSSTNLIKTCSFVQYIHMYLPLSLSLPLSAPFTKSNLLERFVCTMSTDTTARGSPIVLIGQPGNMKIYIYHNFPTNRSVIITSHVPDSQNSKP